MNPQIGSQQFLQQLYKGLLSDITLEENKKKSDISFCVEIAIFSEGAKTSLTQGGEKKRGLTWVLQGGVCSFQNQLLDANNMFKCYVEKKPTTTDIRTLPTEYIRIYQFTCNCFQQLPLLLFP